MTMGPSLQVELTITRLKEIVVHALQEIHIAEAEELGAIAEASVKDLNIVGMVRDLTEIAVRQEVEKAVRRAIAGLFSDDAVHEAVRAAARRLLGVEPNTKHVYCTDCGTDITDNVYIVPRPGPLDDFTLCESCLRKSLTAVPVVMKEVGNADPS